MKFLGSSLLLSFLKWTLADMTKEVNIEQLETCLDHKGKVVSHGDRFFPLGSDPCTQCTCLNGKPEMCIAVFCSPPENCRQYHALSDKCCEFVCLDRDFPNKASGNGTYPDLDTLSTTNLGLRLVASTVTSFLILALLLFMIHRLRQRRLLLMIRRFHARRMENGNSHLSRRYSEDDDGSVGYFVGHDQLDFSRYDEPPPPYTLWKPPEMYIPPGEAPPPYDLSVQLTAPYAGNGRYTYSSTGQVSVNQQAIISVHSENHQPSRDSVMPTTSSTVTDNVEHTQNNNNIETTAEIEVNNLVNSNDSAVLPPDIQYEETCCYRTCCAQPDVTVISSDAHEDNTASDGNAADATASTSTPCDDDVIACTSTCTCTTTVSKKGKSYKRHSCSEFSDQNRSRPNVGKTSHDKRFSLNPAVSQDNNNLYPDPTAWGAEVSESSSSSSPTYDQPTLSPSTSDSSSADADFPRVEHVLNGTLPCSSITNNRTSLASQELPFENSRSRDFGDDISKPPNFQKTLSNLKKFSLIKRKKKKRRVERQNEISCSFVCQSVTDNLHSAQNVFEDGMDLTARNCDGISSRPLEAINPHIGHKLASSGLRGKSRPTSINISGQPYRQTAGLDDGAGPSYLNYGDDAQTSMSSSVVTVSGGAIDGNCIACRNSSSPDSICEGHRSQGDGNATLPSHSLSRQGISRSGSICSETGERRHHRSAGSSPAMASRSIHHDAARYMDRTDNRYASSSHITFNDRTVSNGIRLEVDDSAVRHIPVWIVNSVAVPSRHEYESPSVHSSTIHRSASSNFRESSRSVGDISSPLDFRDSMLSSGSSWEACSHL